MKVEVNFFRTHFYDGRQHASNFYVVAKPRELRAALGVPDQTHGGTKLTAEWYFGDDMGNKYCLYDYKQTSEYQKGKPTPDEFWASDKMTCFHLSSSLNMSTHDANRVLGNWISGLFIGFSMCLSREEHLALVESGDWSRMVQAGGPVQRT